MNVQWLTSNQPGVVSIYETNITLNTKASKYFESVYTTMIGYNKQDQTLVIKALSREDVELGNYNPSDLHPISIKPSYARINGKALVSSLCSVFPLDFSQQTMFKYECEWDGLKKYLKVYLRKEVK